MDQIRVAILLMALALPAQAMTATYRGLNEAYQNFRGISVVRMALGAINFGGPYLISFYTANVAALVGTVALSRLAGLAIYRQLAWSCVGRAHRETAVYSTQVARRLFAFGGWVTVSSVASPVLLQADRFVIGATISAAAVTDYVLPYEVVSQSLVLVGAISSVAFPTLSSLVSKDPAVWRPYFMRWLTRVATLMACVCIVIAVILPSALDLWLGPALNPVSVSIGQILCLGVFANSIGAMFYALIHARGRSDLVARLHLIELPLYLLGLYYSVSGFGLVGAACAWSGRMIFDAVWLSILARDRHA